MSSVLSKPAFCIYKNKGAEQLRGIGTADQCLLFLLHSKYNPSTSSMRNFKPLAICGCTARCVSYLVGNREDKFSHYGSHMHREPRTNGQISLQGYHRLISFIVVGIVLNRFYEKWDQVRLQPTCSAMKADYIAVDKILQITFNIDLRQEFAKMGVYFHFVHAVVLLDSSS